VYTHLQRHLAVDSKLSALHGLLFMSGPLLAFLAFLVSKPVWMDFSFMTRRGSGYFVIFILLHRRRSYYSVWNGGLGRRRQCFDVG